VSYLCYYLGPVPVDQIDVAVFAKFREDLMRDGPRSFFMKQDGNPRAARGQSFTNTAVNRITGTLMAALRLAEREGVIDRAPFVDMLPLDRSDSIEPPSEDQLDLILAAAEKFTDVAPYMVEAIKLAAWSGLRAGEQFSGLTWRCIEFNAGTTGAIKIGKQHKVKMVDGRAWTPKHLKSRIVPLMPELKALLLDLRSRVPNGPDDPVIPSRGGSPYVRLEAAPDKAGKGFFPDVVVEASIDKHVRWHDLRHAFAVRALLAGIPIAVVSAWLGHSDVNLTVKRYGRWASDNIKQWDWAARMSPTPKQLPAATEANVR
jgi:integrase